MILEYADELLGGGANLYLNSLFDLEPPKRTRAPVKATPKNIIMRPPQSTTRLPSELQAPWKIQIIGTLEGEKNHLKRVHV